VFGEHVPREPPQLIVEAVEHRAAVYAHSLHDLLIEVVEQHLAGIALTAADLGLEKRSGCQGLTRDGAQRVDESPFIARR